MLRTGGIAALFVFLFACDRGITYPPPPQRTPVVHGINAVLQLKSGQADQSWASILQDVAPPVPGVDWRWTSSHPAFQFQLLDTTGWKASIRLTAVGKILDARGSQHVSVSVNGEPVGRAILDHSGTYDLTFPVGATILKSAAPAILRLDIDPCLVSDSPFEKSVTYCVLLHSAGFVRDAQ